MQFYKKHQQLPLALTNVLLVWQEGIIYRVSRDLVQLPPRPPMNMQLSIPIVPQSKLKKVMSIHHEKTNKTLMLVASPSFTN